MDDKIDNFKNDLKDLLKKYNAEIYIDLDGDTHGVSCFVVIDVDNKEVIRHDSCISHSDF